MSKMIGEILSDRYQIIEVLAKKAGRRTLLAKNIQTEELVVVKLLTFSQEFEWEDLKLFEREVQTLKFISHPCVPTYLDYFDWDSDRGKHLALVHTYAEGESLENQLRNGRHFTELELQDLARQILEILIYLHGLKPPVIHRDIKPSNIILGNRSGHSVGQVYLVDFGSVQTLAAKDNGTITIVGTYGYMPPEQFGGRVVSASDLYSLGATLIFLATGIHPADLPQVEGRIDFSRLTNFSVGFTNWLRCLTDFSLERRFSDAMTALKMLNERSLSDIVLVNPAKPIHRKTIWRTTSKSCELTILPTGFQSLIGWTIPIAIGSFAGTIAAVNGALSSPFPQNILGLLIIFPIASISLIAIIAMIYYSFGKVVLTINSHQIYLSKKILGLSIPLIKASRRSEIDKISYEPTHFKKDDRGDRIKVSSKVIVWAGVRKYEIKGGDEPGSISEREIYFCAQELSDWLGLPLS
jgi:serine/threonine protein kinase